VKVNKVRYKDVKPDRIRRCAELLSNELKLSVKVPADPIADKIYNDQISAVETAIAKIIINNNLLQIKFDKVWRKFKSSVNRIDKKQILKTSNILTNKRHMREPNAIAAAFIYKVFKDKLTFRQVRKFAGCGVKSMHKVLRIIH
jgi:hypothetical protein